MIDNYSPISVTLASGRVVRVDMLLIEAMAFPLHATAYPEAEMPLLARRPWLDWAEKAWYEPGPIHFKIEDHDAESVESADRLLVTALLYSTPMGSEGGFSELLVVTYVNWKAGGGVQLALQEVLSDLEWDVLAVDRPLHTKHQSP